MSEKDLMKTVRDKLGDAFVFLENGDIESLDNHITFVARARHPEMQELLEEQE